MTQLEAEFTSRYPRTQLQVQYLRPERIYAAARTDEVDLGIVSYPEPAKDLAVIPWRDEEMVVAAAPSHAIASQARVKPDELNGVEFIGFDPDLPIRREVDRYLKDQGVAVTVTMHFDAIPMVKEALALGSGVSILPKRMLKTEIEQRRLVAIRLGPPGLVRPLGVIVRKKKKLNRATQAFLELLQQEPAR
jgi:DNA-binding transcriptional LysR family regulator